MASGWIKASTDVYIRVYQEKSDDTKGSLLMAERWISEDEYVQIQNVDRRRIMYDYKYDEQDPWNTPSVHEWCYEEKEDARSVP